MKMDCFTHVMPQAYVDRFMEAVGGEFYLGNLAEKIPEMVDLERRIRMMDALGVDVQVLTIATPPIEEIVQDPGKANDLAKVANDSIAAMAASQPERFLAVGTIAMNNMEAGVREAERAVRELGMKGILIYSNCQGRAIDAPEFMPFYALMEQLDLPIWLHPARTPMRPDYVDEQTSKYAMWQLFGWPFETSLAMTRLIFAGVFDRYPKLKIITHHAGAMIPYFDKRIEYVYPLFQHLGGLGDALDRLNKPLLDYYRMFYNDTAVMGSVGAMHAAYAFFGPEHLLFGTDTPFDTQGGALFTRETMFTIEALPIPPREKQAIFGGNLERLLKLQ
jgi:uncharacterized protein